jgi:hypothetical protein
MKKLTLNVETLQVEQFQTNPSVNKDDGTVHAYSGWYSDPCLYCQAYPISVTPNVCHAQNGLG